MTTPQEVREWLRDNGKSVDWLAEKIGETRFEVYNALGSGIVPPRMLTAMIRVISTNPSDFPNS